VNENLVLPIISKKKYGWLEVLLHQFQISSIDGSGQYHTGSPTKKETSAYFVWKDTCKGDKQNTHVPTKRPAFPALTTLVATWLW
jgi:hypothetical protein